ncbi:hypothetical protein PHYBLDRAFT_162593 [Phycomyces blakesleeanus NRRL 1555(-)]|uniref:Uncharacterized protein n=1 Tax=Phycomyces blakesleeanus (strain ATCC 8743b / DSM 1359 / FGSC 10004 / NBRC 33097 / NRRL 1555) TaxID=763407 RepID=A0A162V2L1_PHYB8|nr:hypothetical protein PHYBLDRAFT_162593 [Phycomyces blakesleeanus NRRL 1555(-)]OAD79532.1 hypothetical protein PHYBLDRAFT_162593 [Phycomyces blakesleeanus NRRL 1555(-)]|eukprot:XP_018297572.1 hypothetical protein PHYBLDRAFT_162593 [Phycomyces blakesleeanus NRRL 1555(-)]
MPLNHFFRYNNTKELSTRPTAFGSLRRPLLCLTRSSFVDQASKKTFQTPPTPPASKTTTTTTTIITTTTTTTTTRPSCHSLPTPLTVHKPDGCGKQDKRRGKTFDNKDKDLQLLQRQLAAYEKLEQAWEDRRKDHHQRERYMQRQLRDTHLGLVELQSQSDHRKWLMCRARS